jgi:hypothetical protein
VAPNVAAAMRQLRSSCTPQVLWIDVICIDQISNVEKNHQVALMGRIYSLAQSVIVWLGPEFPSSQSIMESMSLADHERMKDDYYIIVLETLLQRDWFGRIWVAQELALASHDPKVYCGTASTHWSLLSRAIESVGREALELL